MIPTGWQIHEGRELIGMAQADLASAAGVGLAVAVRAEMAAYIPLLKRRDALAIQHVMEAARVEFLQESGGRDVQLRKVEP